LITNEEFCYRPVIKRFTRMETSESMNPSPFFLPATGWVGDVIPIERSGEFWLYYLHDVRESPKPGTSWNLVVTRDFVTFEDRGVALPHGRETDADFNAYTGSVVTDDSGVAHLFYTGQNPALLGDDGLPLQVVMHATSSDGMTTWDKRPDEQLGATPGYETADWRDPFVFRDGHGLWRMLLAARHSEGPDRRRGTIAQLTSSDLSHWSPAEPFWDPRRYITHECPDVFQWGDWWYLVYSEFSETFTTRYRISRSPNGPWEVPPRDSIDGRAFYASKSVERDGRRFFCGWIATREASSDDGAWEWAGTMSVLEAGQDATGSLKFGFPAEIPANFTDEVEVAFQHQLPITLDAASGYIAQVSRDDIPERCFVRAVFEIAPDTTECGLLLRATEDGDQSYIIRLEPKRSRLVFDRWPRRRIGQGQWEVSGDVPFEIELERPCDLDPGEHTLEVLMDGDICVAVVDGCVALSTRIYDRPTGRLGVFAGEGSAVVTSIQVRH
jgi:beta-fructofuranosidase